MKELLKKYRIDFYVLLIFFLPFIIVLMIVPTIRLYKNTSINKFVSTEQSINCKKELYYYSCNINYFSDNSAKDCYVTENHFKIPVQEEKTVYYNRNICSKSKIKVLTNDIITDQKNKKSLYPVIIPIIFLSIFILSILPMSLKELLISKYLIKHGYDIIYNIPADVVKTKQAINDKRKNKVSFEYKLPDGEIKKFKYNIYENRDFDTVTLIVSRVNRNKYLVLSPYEIIIEDPKV